MPNAEWNCFLSPKNKPATPNLYSKITEQEQLGQPPFYLEKKGGGGGGPSVGQPRLIWPGSQSFIYRMKDNRKTMVKTNGQSVNLRCQWANWLSCCPWITGSRCWTNRPKVSETV